MEIHVENLDSVPVVDQDGSEAGAVYYIPGDLGIVQRFPEAEDALVGFLTEAKALSVRADGTAPEGNAAALKDLEGRIYDTVDRVCGVATAREAFGQHRPFERSEDDTFWLARVASAMTRIPPRVSARLQSITGPGLPAPGKSKWRRHK